MEYARNGQNIDFHHFRCRLFLHEDNSYRPCKNVAIEPVKRQSMTTFDGNSNETKRSDLYN